jgi:hypothetical protein
MMLSIRMLRSFVAEQPCSTNRTAGAHHCSTVPPGQKASPKVKGSPCNNGGASLIAEQREKQAAKGR